MPDIDIRHPHTLSPDQAREAVQEVADTLSRRFGVTSEWVGDALGFSTSGVDGRITLAPNELHVRAKLGFLMSAFKGQIESEVRRILDERFG